MRYRSIDVDRPQPGDVAHHRHLDTIPPRVVTDIGPDGTTFLVRLAPSAVYMHAAVSDYTFTRRVNRYGTDETSRPNFPRTLVQHRHGNPDHLRAIYRAAAETAAVLGVDR